MAQRQIRALRRGMQEERWTEAELEPLRLEMERPLWRVAAWLSLALYAAMLLLHGFEAPAVWSTGLIFPMAGYTALAQVVRRPRTGMFAGLE